MTPWGKICRICASPADYEIFANIPIYLHANCKDYLDWQNPINEMLEETTGLKVSPDDGLPKNICALCISYLKHAKTFREQAINTCLNFLAVKEYKNIVNDKKVSNYVEIIDEVSRAQRNYNDDDNLKNNQNKDNNKVSKQLMSNTNINNAPTLSRQIQQSLQYLCKLYDNNLNAASTATTSNLETGNGAYKSSMVSKQRRQYNKTVDMMANASGCNSKRQNLEDDLPRTTSSDEYETPEETGNGHIKNNIFSYKEKNFEEDDIMDLDELKDAITINIPSTCKEHKCSFCFKRFMFEESFSEHIKTCIEYKFATFLDEMNNLLYIRRAKEISPHEFIRRMIFSLRKTCEWLKENCIDMTLPDLLQNNQTSSTNAANKERLISEASSTEPEQFTQKVCHNKLNKTLIATSSPLLAPRSSIIRNTPINMSNNILHEIERSESRNSQNMILKKPIPILATSSTINTINNLQTPNMPYTSQDSERLAFMEKLQNAAKPTVANTTVTTPVKPILQLTKNNTPTPLISVRQDLLDTITTNTSNTHTSPLLELLHQSISSHNSTTPIVNPCARCPQCNLYFDTLDSLEIHNATQHNNLTSATCVATSTEPQTQDELDSEHKRIIALFEDDDM
ncbi:uncharacterized protein ACRADG_005970 [Cochliomyia hominivorax]